jgi:hypothetical protein
MVPAVVGSLTRLGLSVVVETGAGDGAGLLNQIIDIDHGELREGDNTLELRSAGTWTGSYRVGVAAVDLLLNVL